MQASIDRHHFRVSVSNDSILFAFHLNGSVEYVKTDRAREGEREGGSCPSGSDLLFFVGFCSANRPSAAIQLIILYIITCILPVLVNNS